MRTFFLIILTIRIEVGNQLKYVGNIDYVAMQQFQTEINITNY